MPSYAEMSAPELREQLRSRDSLLAERAGDILHLRRQLERCKSERDDWRQQALHDPLTGAANRALFQDRLELALNGAKRHEQKVALLLIDLDSFKGINDRFGHPAGDAFLKSVTERLRACVRATDTVARLGGDEFAVVLPDVKSAAVAEKVAQKIVSALGKPTIEPGRVILAGASVGIALWPSDGQSVEDLLASADKAMYRAKGAGKNQYAVAS